MGNLCCMGRAKPVALAPPVLWKAPPAELFIGPFTDPEWGPWPPPAGTPPPAKAAPLLPPPLAGGAPQPAASRGAPQPAVSRFGICLPRASSRAQADALAARPAPAARVALSIMHVVRTIRNFLVAPWPNTDLTGLYDFCLLSLFQVVYPAPEGQERATDALRTLRRHESRLRAELRRQLRAVRST